jgi:hypothetical protein
LYTAFGLLGPPLGAVLAERLGVGRVFTITGIALTLLGAVVILLRPPAAPGQVVLPGRWRLP